jgi:hypothetical protein
MTILSYQLAQGQTRWFSIVDLPPGPDGKRRQKKKRGYLTQEAALKGERELLTAFGSAELAANGTLTAELDAWLAERELDLSRRPSPTPRRRALLHRPAHRPSPALRHRQAVDQRVVQDLAALRRQARRPVVGRDGADRAPGFDEGAQGHRDHGRRSAAAPSRSAGDDGP